MEKSIKKSGPGADKRFWSEEEDKKLIDALLELSNTGKYNADNGFKPGHYIAVEKKLSVSLPNSGLRAEPHIASRMKTLKKHFNIVHDMLCGLNTSGFGYDSEKKCVVAETEVWEEYLKSHKDAQKFKGKPFPYYKELCIVFGKDRATGKDTETPADVIEELIMEECETQTKNTSADDFGSGLDVFMEFMQSGRVESTNETNSKKKRKTTSETVEDTICEVIKDSVAMISSKMEASSERLSLAIEDANINEQKRMLNSELMKLQNLSKLDRHKATIAIGRDRDLTQIFFTISDDEKADWVKALIS